MVEWLVLVLVAFIVGLYLYEVVTQTIHYLRTGPSRVSATE